MALDTKDDLIFVTNHGSVHQVRPGAVAASGRIRESDLRKSNWPLGFSNAIPGSGKNLPPSITVYARTASGDTAPLRVIQGPKTQMNWPTELPLIPGATSCSSPMTWEIPFWSSMPLLAAMWRLSVFSPVPRPLSRIPPECTSIPLTTSCGWRTSATIQPLLISSAQPAI